MPKQKAVSATLSLSFLPASIHSLPWDPHPADAACCPLPRSCLVHGILSKSFPSKGQALAPRQPRRQAQGSGAPRGPKRLGENIPHWGPCSRRGLQDGGPPGGHIGLSTLQHTCGSSVKASDVGFTVGRVTRGLAATLAKERGALSRTCRSGQNFKPQAGECFPGQNSMVRRPTDTGRARWDRASQQVSALPLGALRSHGSHVPSRTFSVHRQCQ